jgi:DNA-binding SARP family transcriptional activator
MEKAIHFDILGPIRVRAADNEITITGRERTLLAVLLLHANQPVETSRLIDAIWGDAPPRDARNQLQGCVSKLRKHLASAGIRSHMIRTDPAGYRIGVDEDTVDLRQFHRRLTDARRAAETGRHRDARDGYRAALALWRGPAWPASTAASRARRRPRWTRNAHERSKSASRLSWRSAQPGNWFLNSPTW